MPLCAVLCRADVYFVLKGKLFLLSLYKHERSQDSDDLCSFICMLMILKNWSEGHFQITDCEELCVYIHGDVCV